MMDQKQPKIPWHQQLEMILTNLLVFILMAIAFDLVGINPFYVSGKSAHATYHLVRSWAYKTEAE